MKITGVRWAESAKRKNSQGVITVRSGTKRLVKMIEEVGLDLEYDINAYGGLVMNCDNDDTAIFLHRCVRTQSVIVNPIVDWSDNDVWEFLYHYGIKVNPLYEVKETNCTYCPFGEKRIGCNGCPMSGRKGMIKDFIRYPKYRDNYLRAFKRMQERRLADGLPPFGYDLYGNMTPQQIMMWWVGDDPRQLSLFGEPEYLKGACL